MIYMHLVGLLELERLFFVGRGGINEKPTGLHLYIYVEQYYAGIPTGQNEQKFAYLSVCL